MFYSKKIKALEEQVANLEKELVDTIKDVERLKEYVDMLSISCTVMQFDADEQVMALEGRSKGQINLVLKMGEEYEKRLRNFIHKCTSKPRPKKSCTNFNPIDGKENTKATK